MRRTHSQVVTTLVTLVTLVGLASGAPVAHAAPRLQPSSLVDVGTTPAARAATPAATAAAAVKVPGNFTGLGFDACAAPDQATLDELRTKSPYWGVGVYIGGENRSCPQPNLTRDWVSKQNHRGWHIFPLWIGLQAPVLDPGGPGEKQCSDRAFGQTMKPDNTQARAQGVSAANRAVKAAQRFGMAKGSTLFLDMESYDNATSACNQPVQNFQSGWSTRLHKLGWKSGYYSSAATGIAALDYVRATFPGTYTMPDAIWFARDNGEATTDGKPHVRDEFWRNQRVHQYKLDVTRTYGSVQLTLDENAIVIGKGSTPGKARRTCGVDLDFARYRSYSRGDRSTQVKAAQCLLKQRGLFRPRISGQYDVTTARGVGDYQRRQGLRVTRKLDRGTWTALLSGGATPLVKRGSAGDRVRFLQRALTAALGKSVRISGSFDGGTTTAVKRYQRAIGLTKNGVVSTSTWKALQRGRR